MITKLTNEQEKKIPEYLDKWLKVGYRTDAIDEEVAKSSADFIYTDILKMNKPKYYIFLDSPMACNLAINLLKSSSIEIGRQLDSLLLCSQLYSQLYSQLDSQLNSQLRRQLDSQLGSQLGSQLYSQLDSQLDSQLYSKLYSQILRQLDNQLGRQLNSRLYSQLRSQLYSQLDSQLDSQLGRQLYSQLNSRLYSQLRSQLYSQLYSQLDSQLDSQLGSKLDLDYFYDSGSNINPRFYYFWSYDFILNELFKNKIKDFSKFNQYMDAIKNVHLTYIFEDIVFFSNFPKNIRLNSENKLHCENGYALEYRDNYGLFSVNGEVKNVKKISKNKLTLRTYPKGIIQDNYILIPEV